MQQVEAESSFTNNTIRGRALGSTNLHEILAPELKIDFMNTLFYKKTVQVLTTPYCSPKTAKSGFFLTKFTFGA